MRAFTVIVSLLFSLVLVSPAVASFDYGEDSYNEYQNKGLTFHSGHKSEDHADQRSRGYRERLEVPVGVLFNVYAIFGDRSDADVIATAYHLLPGSGRFTPLPDCLPGREVNCYDEQTDFALGNQYLHSRAYIVPTTVGEHRIGFLASNSSGQQVFITAIVNVVEAEDEQSPDSSACHNADNPHNVNMDSNGVVNWRDVWGVITAINRYGSGASLSASQCATSKPDVNGDGVINPADVQEVVNAINRRYYR